MRRFLALLAVVAITLVPGGLPWTGAWPAAGIARSDGSWRYEGEIRPDGGRDGADLGIRASLNVETGEFALVSSRPFDAGSAKQRSSWRETLLLDRGGSVPTAAGGVDGEKTGVRIDEEGGEATGRVLMLLLAKGPARLEEGCRTGARVEASYRIRFAVGGVPYTVKVRAFDLRRKLPRVEIGDGR